MATLTSQLEAVNTCLGYLGEAPVNSISNTSELPVSAANAVSILDEVSREVQSEGWHFNTVKEYVLSPTNNSITLPTNTLQVDHEGTENVDLVQRGLSLYDRKNQTTTFTSDIKVTIVLLLDWDDLPEQARRYIALRATRSLQALENLKHLSSETSLLQRLTWKDPIVLILIEQFLITLMP